MLIDKAAIDRILKAVALGRPKLVPASLDADALRTEIDYATQAYTRNWRPLERSPTERRTRLVLRSMVKATEQISRLVSSDDPVGVRIVMLLRQQAEEHGFYEGLTPPSSFVVDGPLVTNWGGEIAINRMIESIAVVDRAIEFNRLFMSWGTDLLDRDALAWSWKDWGKVSAFTLFVESLGRIYEKHFRRPVGFSHRVGSAVPEGPWVRFAVATLEAVGAKNRDGNPYGPESIRAARRTRQRHGEKSLEKKLVHPPAQPQHGRQSLLAPFPSSGREDIDEYLDQQTSGTRADCRR